MSFDIKQVNETSQAIEAGEKLWLTADRDRVVKDGDPEAAFLLATPGKRIPLDEAERLGLTGKSKAKAKPKPETKEAAPAEDKVADVAEDKDSEAKWPHTHDELDALGERLGVTFDEAAKVAEKQEALEAAGHTPADQ